MKWLQRSLVLQAILALYLQLVSWLPLGRWNYQPGFVPLGVEAAHGGVRLQDVLLTAAFAAPFVLFWLAYAKGWRWLMWIGTLGYASWLALQVKTWWVGYLFGASDSWVRIYQRVFSHSTQVLPSFGRHLAPDGMHLVIQILLTGIVVSAVVGLLRTSRRMNRSGHLAVMDVETQPRLRQ